MNSREYLLAINFNYRRKLNLIITDTARDEFKKMFEKENAKNIRIFFDGFG